MRKLLFAVALLLAANFAHAQKPLGFKLGVNLSQTPSSNVKTRDYSLVKAGFQAGLTYQLPITESFGFQTELVYGLQTSRENYYGTDLRLSYLQVPVLAQYRPANSKVKFYAGPQLAFLQRAVYKADGQKAIVRNGDFNQTDFGVAYGVSTLPSKSGFSVDFRLYNGLMNVFKTTYDNGIRSRNNVLSVSIGYRFK